MSASEWKPIAEAPRDGTRVLYSGATDGIIRWVTMGRWVEDAGWYEINTDPTDARSDEDYPTHWMPLPAPPTEGADAT